MPNEDPKIVFLRCVDGFGDKRFKDRLRFVAGLVERESAAFARAAENGDLHLIRSHARVGGIVTAREMGKVYVEKFVPKGSPGRPVYDRLLSSAPDGMCPLCGQRVVSTLDHYLPKSKYPSLSVTPCNLVPSCKDCNVIKRDCASDEANEQTLHPYFDAVDQERWLTAEVVRGKKAAFRFRVDAPVKWPRLLAERTRYHFRTLRLARLYGSHAAAELTSIQFMLRKLFTRRGESAVRQHALDQAESREAALCNSWEGAMYRAMSESDWFCRLGFSR